MRKMLKWIVGILAVAGAAIGLAQMAAGDVTKDFIAVGWHANIGKTTVFGTVTLDGSNPTPIDLSAELATIDFALVTFEASVAPGLDPTLVTHAISGQTLNVYAWKPTAAGDTALVASTNNTDEVAFMAVGNSI